MNTNGLLVFCINNNHCMMPTNFFWSYLRMMKPNGSFAVQGAGSIKSSAINAGITQALTLGAEWMFLMDVDQLFPQNTIPKLLDTAEKHNAKIVSVLYHVNAPPFAPVAGWFKDEVIDGVSHRTSVNSRGGIWKLDYAPLGEGVVEVDWVGAGGLLIHKDVIDAVGWPPFVDVFEPGKGTRSLGHDMVFCARAKEKGFKTLVDTSVLSSHGAFTYFDKEFIDAYQETGMVDQLIKGTRNQAMEPGYWDTIWQTENIKKMSRIESYKESAENVRDIVPNGAYVADMGCGLGDMMDYLRKSNGCKCAGYDFSEQAIEIVKEKGHEGFHADFRKFDINGDARKYDCVVSLHTIEHIKEDEKFVGNMKSLCKIGGKVVIVTPWRPEIQGHFEHVRGYDEGELKKLASKFFVDFEVRKNNRDYLLVAVNG